MFKSCNASTVLKGNDIQGYWKMYHENQNVWYGFEDTADAKYDTDLRKNMISLSTLDSLDYSYLTRDDIIIFG